MKAITRFIQWLGRRPARLAWGVVLTLASQAHAQFRVEIAGVGAVQVPIAIASLRGEDAAQSKLAAIVRADLERSGQFKIIDAGSAAMDENTRLDASTWRQRNADVLASGSVQLMADGRYELRVRLWDVVTGQDRGVSQVQVLAGDLRLGAHRIADAIYQKLTGEKGVFSTRIVYVTRAGSRHTLWVADADGQQAQAAISSPEPIISPAWSPNGTHLAYVSFESKKPVIVVHDLARGQRRVVANFKGSNSAPAWSPDGKNLAVTLSRDGGSQIYLMDAQGGEPRRLMQTSSIDTEPAFAPDGSSLYFVSDRGGQPQIYRVPIQGGAAQRVTFQGNYNISPAPSPDGRYLAYISRIGAQFRLHVLDLNSNQVTALTDTHADESPSFSPNGRLILFATQQGGREQLMTSTVDGKIKTRLSGQGGDIREPDWGPYLK